MVRHCRNNTKELSKVTPISGFALAPTWINYCLLLASMLRGNRKGAKLQRLFTAFPDGWSGVALLQLRVVTGLTLVFHGVAYLNSGSGLTFKDLAAGAVSMAIGACLIAGLLTPVACLLTLLGTIGLAFSWLPVPAQNTLNGNLVIINLMVMAIAIALLGPGAYSLDSRMFGRREILIPTSGRGTSTPQRKQEF